MPIPAGKLDRRIGLLRPVAGAKDRLNRTTTTYQDAGSIWAGKRDVGDAERVRAAEVGSTVSSRFIVRAAALPTGFDPTWRVTAAPLRGAPAVQYDIVAVKEAETAWGVALAPGEAVEISALARSERA